MELERAPVVMIGGVGKRVRSFVHCALRLSRRQESHPAPTGGLLALLNPAFLHQTRAYLDQRSSYDPADFQVFRSQELVLITLNCVTLFALLLIHAAFIPHMVDISMMAPALMGVRLLEQGVEGLWLYRRRNPMSRRTVRFYGYLSIVVNLAFAVLVSVFAHNDEAHYLVLLFFPLIAACFRSGLVGTLVVSGLASSLAFVEMWMVYGRDSLRHVDHFFEIATMIPMYPIVGSILWILVDRMRRDTVVLQQALAELDHARDRMVQDEKLAAIGRLASSVAHEIRNPVAMITSALSMAGREGQDPALREEFAAIAGKEARRLEQITGDFLDYARMREPRVTRESVREMLDYAADVVRPRLEERGVTVRVECPEGVAIDVDASMLQQALMNLLLNAIAYTAEGNAVTMRVKRHDGQVDLQVENPGAPVPEADVGAIFEPFYTTRPSGTGLGLAISQSIARAHGGELSLTRNEPGAVCFTLSLPCPAGDHAGE